MIIQIELFLIKELQSRQFYYPDEDNSVGLRFGNTVSLTSDLNLLETAAKMSK